MDSDEYRVDCLKGELFHYRVMGVYSSKERAETGKYNACSENAIEEMEIDANERRIRLLALNKWPSDLSWNQYMEIPEV